MTKQPTQGKKRRATKKRQPDPRREAVGKRIKEARLKKGLNQPELARQAGVTANAVTQWEGGWTEPSMQNYMTLAGIFGTTVEFLRTGVEREGPVEAQNEIEVELLRGARKLSLRDKIDILHEIDKRVEKRSPARSGTDIKTSSKTLSSTNPMDLR